jgi:hypothetical protein
MARHLVHHRHHPGVQLRPSGFKAGLLGESGDRLHHPLALFDKLVLGRNGEWRSCQQEPKEQIPK